MLKRGGRWQALEGLLSGAPISEAQEEAHAIAQRGWRMPPLEPWAMCWLHRASQEFMEATIGYDQGLREGVFSYRFVSGARPK